MKGSTKWGGGGAGGKGCVCCFVVQTNGARALRRRTGRGHRGRRRCTEVILPAQARLGNLLREATSLLGKPPGFGVVAPGRRGSRLALGLSTGFGAVLSGR